MNNFTTPTGDFLISADHRAWAEAILTRVSGETFAENITQKLSLASEHGDDDFWRPELSRYRPYQVKNGTLHIPVQGMLINNFPYVFGGWLTGYEYVTAAVKRGIEDGNVTRIILDVNSPGGLVAGCFDCADFIFTSRGTKPIIAVANEHAYSAAYALASSADSITVARTGGVGSIGVVIAHTDVSAALENNGVKVTLIYAGERKVDGNPYQPLSPEAEQRMQDRIDALYDIFVSTVARNREMDEQAVRATEAATFMAREAVENGLADAVGSLDSLSATADPLQIDEDEEMSNSDTSAVTQAATEEAIAAARAEGVNAGRAEGAQNERTRISAIIGSDEAEGRESLARSLALDTDLSPEMALKALAAGPKASATAAPSAFENAMENGSNPGIGAGGGEEMSVSDSIFASAGVRPAKS